MEAGLVRVELLDGSKGAEMLAINRACPIVSDLTFYFDRGEDFFRWPSLVYERFYYAGLFVSDRLVGYLMVGLVRAWTGDEFGRLGVLGDARILPEHRGRELLGKALVLLSDVVPHDVLRGVFIIKEGNKAAARVRERFRLGGYTVTPVGRLTAQNLLLMRRIGPASGVEVTTATPDDVPAIVELLRDEWRGRLFAPYVDAESFVRWVERPGLGWERTYVARRDGGVVGVLGAWDMGEFHAARVVSYPLGANMARGVHAAARLVLRDAAPLPAPGETLRSLTITNVATAGGDPEVLRALLVAVNNDHLEQGFHMMHVGVTAPSGRSPALRSWYRQEIRSTINLISRGGEPPAALIGEPYLDLAII